MKNVRDFSFPSRFDLFSQRQLGLFSTVCTLKTILGYLYLKSTPDNHSLRGWTDDEWSMETNTMRQRMIEDKSKSHEMIILFAAFYGNYAWRSSQNSRALLIF